MELYQLVFCFMHMVMMWPLSFLSLSPCLPFSAMCPSATVSQQKLTSHELLLAVVSYHRARKVTHSSVGAKSGLLLWRTWSCFFWEMRKILKLGTEKWLGAVNRAYSSQVESLEQSRVDCEESADFTGRRPFLWCSAVALDAFCLCYKNLLEATLKSKGGISLVEDISRLHNVDSVVGLLLMTLLQVYSEKTKWGQKGIQMYHLKRKSTKLVL